MKKKLRKKLELLKKFFKVGILFVGIILNIMNLFNNNEKKK